MLTDIEQERPKDGLIGAVGEKYRLFLVPAVLAVMNLLSQHLRHRGLSGSEMLIGTLVLSAAVVLYAYLRAVWDARVGGQNLEAKEDRQDRG